MGKPAEEGHTKDQAFEIRKRSENDSRANLPKKGTTGKWPEIVNNDSLANRLKWDHERKTVTIYSLARGRRKAQKKKA